MFFSPMYDSSTEGVPAQLLILGFAVALMIAGAIWVRRIVTIEPEVHSFRATAPPTRDLRAASLRLGVGILVTLTVTLIWLGLVR